VRGDDVLSATLEKMNFISLATIQMLVTNASKNQKITVCEEMQIIYLNVWLPLTCIVCLCWILKYLMNHQNIAIIKSTIRQCRIFVCGVFSFKIQHFAFAITKAGTLLSRASYLICAGKSVRPVLGS